MPADDYREMSADELAEALDEAKEELFNLRFQLATNQLTNTGRIGQVKKEIARIKTVAREMELAAEEGAR
ncbi:MAG: 50S ribosomal protein L29 [Acidimicrobiia bacterium]|nr:MAG: 50S ribosomal protein L29 [Acidimicrobiia bacterium]